MIKNLKLKFVLVFLILVVSVFITSSCYAMTVESAESLPFSVEDIYSNATLIDKFTTNCGYVPTIDNTTLVVYYSNNTYYCMIIDGINHNYIYNGSGYKYYYGYLNSTTGGSAYRVVLKGAALSYSTGSETATFGEYLFSSDSKIYDCTNIAIYNDNGNTLIYQPEINTSFNYSLIGTKRGQVKLTISGLDSSLNMYGYVGCENMFEIGDVLDTSLIADNLRMISVLLDKSDLDCYLYDGEKFLYYIVDENNIILDIGYITEMCEGYYLYGFPVNDGVDFVFLNDGVPYWSNDLTFKYQVNNGKLFTKNEVVSSGSYVYIETDKTVHNATYYGFVYDSSGNEISKASIIAINNLSSLHVESLNTRYSEFTTGWFSDTTSVYELYNLQLAGTNPDGSYIDFTNYSVRWYIEPYTTLLETVKVNNIDSSKRFGTVSGFDPHFGILENFELEIHQLLGKRIAAFDIVFDIYDGNDNLVLKHIVNSDDIVKDQIIYNEILPNKPNYDILGNPNYSGGNKYPNSDNIQNWEIDDFVSYLGTDNSIFNFFWAFLNNMPTWISTPLSILLIGLVIITLYKFIRG